MSDNGKLKTLDGEEIPLPSTAMMWLVLIGAVLLPLAPVIFLVIVLSAMGIATSLSFAGLFLTSIISALGWWYIVRLALNLGVSFTIDFFLGYGLKRLFFNTTITLFEQLQILVIVLSSAVKFMLRLIIFMIAMIIVMMISASADLAAIGQIAMWLLLASVFVYAVTLFWMWCCFVANSWSNQVASGWKQFGIALVFILSEIAIFYVLHWIL